MSDKSLSVPKKMQKNFDAIMAHVDDVCTKYLNEEYALVCRQMAAQLSRKRPSPLATGRAHTWAAAIAHAVGTVNFLFDASQTPHMKSSELAAAFGINRNTMTSKSKQIRDLLKIGVFEPAWTLPSRMDDNPMVWNIMVNGFIMDARYVSREIQETAYEKGLIPYIPDDMD